LRRAQLNPLARTAVGDQQRTMDGASDHPTPGIPHQLNLGTMIPDCESDQRGINEPDNRNRIRQHPNDFDVLTYALLKYTY
jgi:hypothetical protein